MSLRKRNFLIILLCEVRRTHNIQFVGLPPLDSTNFQPSVRRTFNLRFGNYTPAILQTPLSDFTNKGIVETIAPSMHSFGEYNPLLCIRESAQ